MSGRHKQLSVSLGNLSKEYEDHVKRLFDQHRNLETEARKVKSVLENSVKKLERARDKARVNIILYDWSEMRYLGPFYTFTKNIKDS